MRQCKTIKVKLYPSETFICNLILYVMVKIKKSSEKLNAYLSRVYVSPKHPSSFSGLDKLYRIAKKEFPSITQNEIKQWAEINLLYSLHKPSRRNFKRNKIYAPEIDSLWEADLAFVQDVAKENDGVNYLLVVIDVFFLSFSG